MGSFEGSTGFYSLDIPSNLPRLVLMALFLGLSFFFSGSETALFSLTREDLHRFKNEEGRLGAMICSLLDDPKGLLVTILFGNMVVNVFFYSVSFIFLAQIGRPVVQTVLGLGLLVLVIVFGEVVPKATAVSIPCRFSRTVALPIALLKKITLPVRVLIGGVVTAAMALIPKWTDEETDVTADELKMLVDLSQHAGIIDRGERTMINEIVEFGDIRVREVMTPRVDMTLFELPGTREAFLDLVHRSRHSKVPVYRDDIDNLVGVIHAKDAFLRPDQSLEELTRPIRFVPEFQTIESLLREFREKRTQMAIVVDEYGGFEGMITLEDILEEIVGEIEDEFDEGEEPVRMVNGGYLLSGDLSMREWEELFGDDLMLPGVSTLGGFVATLLGRVPREGDEITYKNLFFVIKKMRRRRVAQVRLELRPDRGKDDTDPENR